MIHESIPHSATPPLPAMNFPLAPNLRSDPKFAAHSLIDQLIRVFCRRGSHGARTTDAKDKETSEFDID